MSKNIDRIKKNFLVHYLLSLYLLTKDSTILLRLYNLINFDLLQVLNNPFRYSSITIRRRREFMLKKHIPNEYKHRCVLEEIKDRFISDYCSCGYTESFPKSRFFLLSPFWETINQLTLQKVCDDMDKWGIDCLTYLQSNFCSYYWNYIQKYIIRYYPIYAEIDSVIRIEDIYNTDKYASAYSYSNIPDHSSSNPVLEYEKKEFINEFKKQLSPMAVKVFNLLLLDYKHKDIAKHLGISENNSRKYKTQIKKAYQKLKGQL